MLDEYVVFVTPTQLQRDIFQRILTRDNIDSISATHTAESLALINLLTKISNSPILLKAQADKVKLNAKAGGKDVCLQRAGVREALNMLPDEAEIHDMKLSGKF